MNRRSFLRRSASVGAAAFAACRRQDSNSGLRLLNVAITPRTSMSGLFVAVERGYFEEGGLQIETHPVNRSPQSIPLVAAGKMDAALPSINTALVNAVAKGARLAIVAARQTLGAVCGRSNTIFGSAATFPEGLSDLRQLRGKKVSISGRQTFTEFSLDVLLGSAGMTSDDVEIVPLKQAEAIAAIYGGRIDALMASYLRVDPTDVSERFVRGPQLADLIPDLQRGFIVFGPTLLDGDVAVGANFLEAYLRGAADFIDGYIPQFFDDLARAEGVEPSVARAQCRDLMVEGGVIDRKSIQRFVDWTVQRGYCSQRPGLDQLVDERFVNRAQLRLRSRA